MHFLRGIRAAAVTTSLALAACSGGSSGVAPAMPQTSTGTANAPTTLNFTLKYPTNFHTASRTASTAARSRGTLYINPTSSDYVTVTVDAVPVTPSGGVQLSSGVSNSDGSSKFVSIAIPSIAGSATTYHSIGVTETDGTNLLAGGIDYNQTITAGGANAFTVTMLMNATQLVYTTNLTNGSGSQPFSNSSPLTLTAPCSPQFFAVYAADGSSGYVLPGTPAGADTNSQYSYPGIPTPYLTSFSTSGGSGTFAVSPLGYTINIGNTSRITANFELVNPYAQQFGTSSSPYVPYYVDGSITFNNFC